MRRVGKNVGFTLTEMVVALSIAMILVTFAATAFHHLIQQTRLTSAINTLHSAINLARSEAIKRNGRVDLIAFDGGWKNGWCVKADNQCIFNQEPLHKDIQVGSTFTDKTAHYIAFTGSGRTRTNTSSHAPQAGTIRFSIGDYRRLLVINFLGRVRVCNPATAPAHSCVDSIE